MVTECLFLVVNVKHKFAQDVLEKLTNLRKNRMSKNKSVVYKMLDVEINFFKTNFAKYALSHSNLIP